MKAEEKKNKILENKKNRVSPKEGKDELIKNKKQDKVEITAAERQLQDIEKLTVDAKGDWEHMETDFEERQSDEHTKYKELPKCDETTERFMFSVEKRTAELEKIRLMEMKIVDCLEKISAHVEDHVDGVILTASELNFLVNLKSTFNETENNFSSFEKIQEDNNKLQAIANRLNMIEKSGKIEINEVLEQQHKVEKELRIINHEDYKIQTEEKKEIFRLEKDQFAAEMQGINRELESTKTMYMELMRKMEKNEINRIISILQDKLDKVRSDNEGFEESVVKQKKEMDYSLLKKELLSLATQYNTVLVNEIKSVY